MVTPVATTVGTTVGIVATLVANVTATVQPVGLVAMLAALHGLLVVVLREALLINTGGPLVVGITVILSMMESRPEPLAVNDEEIGFVVVGRPAACNAGANTAAT